MMAVGYGDVSPSTSPERACAVVAQILGAMAFGFIIVKVTEIVETFDPHATLTRQRLDEIREYMRERRLPGTIQRQIREHFEFSYERVSIFRDMRIMAELPYSQRVKIMFEAHSELIHDIRFFDNLDVVMLPNMLTRLKPQLLDYQQSISQDPIMSEQIYFLGRGTMEMWITEKGKDARHVMMGILRTGSEFEFANALSRSAMLCQYRAETVCEVWWISFHEFIELIQDHPDIVAKLHSVLDPYKALVKEVLESPVKQHGHTWVKSMVLIDSNRVVPHENLGTIDDCDTPKEGKSKPHHIRTLRIVDPAHRHRTTPILDRYAT